MYVYRSLYIQAPAYGVGRWTAWKDNENTALKHSTKHVCRPIIWVDQSCSLWCATLWLQSRTILSVPVCHVCNILKVSKRVLMCNRCHYHARLISSRVEVDASHDGNNGVEYCVCAFQFDKDKANEKLLLQSLIARNMTVKLGLQ